MSAHGIPAAESLLRRVEPNLSAALLVRQEITRVAPPPGALAQVSVSRLVNPGRAYYELVHPLEEDLAAHQKRLAGSGAHDLIEASLAAGVQFTEQWLHGEDAPGEPSLERITARLDACELGPDGKLTPTEIKNVGTEKDRPADEHLEQLGMYCALMGVDSGRVLAVHRDDATGSSRLLVPWKVRFPDPGLIRATMVGRRDQLTEAFAKKDPAGLPGCPWWWARCKYREAGICNCGQREKLVPVIARSAQVERDPEYLQLLLHRASEREVDRLAQEAELTLTLYGFLTPRKTFFAVRSASEEVEVGEEEGAPAAAPTPPPAGTPAARAVARVNTRGVERQVFGAVLRSNRERAGFTSVERDPHVWRIPVVDGKPFLVKVRHVARALGGGATELAGRWGVPDDLRQLALRASLLGVHEGRVYIWNWKLTDAEMKLQVFDVRFDPGVLEEVRAFAEALPRELEAAVEAGDHRRLPLCPRWMCDRCVYAPTCQPDLG